MGVLGFRAPGSKSSGKSAGFSMMLASFCHDLRLSKPAMQKTFLLKAITLNSANFQLRYRGTTPLSVRYSPENLQADGIRRKP